MRTTVNKPQDSMYVLERFVIDPLIAGVKEFTYPTALGQVVQAASSYLVKCSDMLVAEISQAHPAWLYSGMHYDLKYTRGYLTFRSDPTANGLSYILPILNVKKRGQVTTMQGMSVPSKFTQFWTDDVPINYYGTPMEDRLPDQPAHETILSRVIDESKLKVTMLSPCEFEIEVLEDLTDDAWFYLPIANAKGMSTTVWGRAGFDSTLPPGASAGLIKVRTEAVLDAQRGRYMVSDDVLSAVTRPSLLVYQNTQTVSYGVGSPMPTPDWYENLFYTTYKTTDQYKVLEELVTNDTAYMVCGFVTQSSTVGTGLFVRDENKPCIYPFSQTGLGFNHYHTMNQDPDSLTLDVPVRDLLQVDGWLEQLARSTGTNTEQLPEGIVMPFAASELQVEPKSAGPFRPLQYLTWNYNYMVHETTAPIGITPTYLPPDASQHCYVPPLVCRGSTRVNMLSSMFDLDASVSLTIRPSQSWLMAFEGTIDAVPDVILDNAIISMAVLDDPIQGYSRGKMAFHGDRSYRTRTLRNGYGDIVGYETTFTGRVFWANPDVHPTVGRDYTRIGDRSVCNAIYSAMIMAFTGVFPKDTPKGKYLWKPFTTMEAQTGYLNAISPRYISNYLAPRFQPETTGVPMMGQNIITLDVNGIQWSTSADSDGTYTAHRVLEYVGDDPINKTRIATSYYVTVDGDTVPLVGYPMANKPMLIDLDDLSGDWACEVDDMNMTGAFWDDAIGEWVVIAASAQMKKMYRIEVKMDPTETYCTEFLRIRDSRELIDTPHGSWIRLLGLCHTKDIDYADGSENDHIVIYGITDADPSTVDGGANLVVATCRTYMEWDVNKDTVSRIKVDNVTGVPDLVIDPDINWPHGIAVMYPWLYAIGFTYRTRPTTPTVDPLEIGTPLAGAGWQMCLWKIDITSGAINEVIPLQSFESYRFSYGIPANSVDSRLLHRSDLDSVGNAMKYRFGTSSPNQLPASANLPRIANGREFPSVAGICCVAASLLAFSNYGEQMVLINPLTGFIEELGFNVFPFTYPYNRNIAVERETVAALAKFGGKYFHTTHPFFGLCLGDGLPPNNYGAGIDIQDVTNGQSLVRMVKLKNNMLRDQLLEIEITVPEPDVLPNSEMLFISDDAETPKKSITVKGPIEPCGNKNFFVHLHPEFVDPTVMDDKILLYVNAKFARKTVFFGYFVRLEEPEVV